MIPENVTCHIIPTIFIWLQNLQANYPFRHLAVSGAVENQLWLGIVDYYRDMSSPLSNLAARIKSTMEHLFDPLRRISRAFLAPATVTGPHFPDQRDVIFRRAGDVEGLLRRADRTGEVTVVRGRPLMGKSTVLNEVARRLEETELFHKRTEPQLSCRACGTYLHGRNAPGNNLPMMHYVVMAARSRTETVRFFDYNAVTMAFDTKLGNVGLAAFWLLGWRIESSVLTFFVFMVFAGTHATAALDPRETSDNAAALSALGHKVPLTRSKKESFNVDSNSLYGEATTQHASLEALQRKLQTRHVSKCLLYDRLFPCFKYDDPEASKEDDLPGPASAGKPYYVLKSPFPPSIPLAQLNRTKPSSYGNDHTPDSQTIAALSWAPPSEVVDGDAIVQKGQELASSRRLFNCAENDDGYSCEFVSQSALDSQGQMYLSICSVRDPNMETSPPLDCTPFVQFNKEGTLVAVVRTLATREEVGGSGLDDYNIVVMFDREQEHDDDLVLDAVSRALGSKPLSLTVRRTSNRTVTGVTRYKSSQVLMGWNEAVRVDFRISDDQFCPSGVRPKGYKATSCYFYSASLWIDKQKDSDRVNWSMPPDPLYDRYLSALTGSIKRELQLSCQEAVWKDDTTLLCKER